MVILKQDSRGDWFLCRRGNGKKKNIMNYRYWWLVKASCDSDRLISVISMPRIHLPKEFIGKKIRFKVEIINEEE
mgnify:CR=1 FL=1